MIFTITSGKALKVSMAVLLLALIWQIVCSDAFQMSALKPHAHMLPGNSHGMAPAQLRAASRLQAIPPARRSSPGGKLVWNIANPLRPLARNLRQPTIKQAPLKTLMENSVLFDEPVDSSPLSNQLNEISFMPLPLVHSKPNNLQIKTVDWGRIQQNMRQLEIEYDIEIIYAAESGGKDHHVEFVNSNFDIRFVYIRNNRRTYSPNQRTDALSQIRYSCDDYLYNWWGFDIEDAVSSAQVMSPAYVEMLQSSSVYRDDHRFELAAQTNSALVAQPRLAAARLSVNYRSKLGSLLDKSGSRQASDVHMETFMATIRTAAMIEWLRVNFFANENATDAVPPKKLIETNVRVVVEELRAHMDTDVYNALVRLIETVPRSYTYERMARNELLDKWLLAVLNSSYGMLHLAQDIRAQIPENTEIFENVVDSSLLVKFGTQF